MRPGRSSSPATAIIPSPARGSVTYVYTLADNVLAPDGSTVSFPIVITDANGDAVGYTRDR